tara:strand:+ start:333 stop:530 length:198 start_codon:yes stop_codon:yes gene_type:complete
MSDLNNSIGDLLREAHDLARREFWVMHEALSGEYKNSIEQLKDIEELAKLGNLLAKISEARKAHY